MSPVGSPDDKGTNIQEDFTPRKLASPLVMTTGFMTGFGVNACVAKGLGTAANSSHGSMPIVLWSTEGVSLHLPIPVLMLMEMML